MLHVSWQQNPLRGEGRRVRLLVTCALRELQVLRGTCTEADIGIDLVSNALPCADPRNALTAVGLCTCNSISGSESQDGASCCSEFGEVR